MKKTILSLILIALICLAGCGQAQTDNSDESPAPAGSDTTAGGVTDETTGEDTTSELDAFWADKSTEEVVYTVQFPQALQNVILYKNGECVIYGDSEFEPLTTWNWERVGLTEGECEQKNIEKLLGTYDIKDGKFIITASTDIYLSIELRGKDAEAYKKALLEYLKDEPKLYETTKQALETHTLYKDIEGYNIYHCTLEGEKLSLIYNEMYYDNGNIYASITLVNDYPTKVIVYDENGKYARVEEEDKESSTTKLTQYENGEIIYIETCKTEYYDDTKSNYKKTTIRYDASNKVLYTVTKEMNDKGSKEVTTDGNGNITESSEFFTVTKPIAMNITKTYKTEGNIVTETETGVHDTITVYEKSVVTDNGVVKEYSYRFSERTNTNSTISDTKISFDADTRTYTVNMTYETSEGETKKEQHTIPEKDFKPSDWERAYS